ncbi:MAG: hypothetical protein L6Q99_16055 [Planctomycetes bacterium]|nr:hypothetical protein [Planctomycetota bacterium]
MLPSPTDLNGRDKAGRFGSGNRIATGNPHAERVRELRNALLCAVGPDEIRDVVAAFVTRAKAGDVQAIRKVLDRTLGRPTEADLLERLAQLESLVSPLGSPGIR